MTIQKNISSSPRKLRLVAEMIRKLKPEQAVELLQFTHKAAALPLAKAIKTAMANAGKAENLDFKKIEINEGIKMKRFRAGTKGRAYPYKKRFSHIKIVLTDAIQKDSENPVNRKVRKSDRSDAAGTLSNSGSSEKKEAK